MTQTKPSRSRQRRAMHSFVVVALLGVLLPLVVWPASSQAAMTAPTVQALPAGQGSSMVMGADGNPIIAYFSEGTPREDDDVEHLVPTDVLTLLFCGDPTCSANNTTVTPEQTPRLYGADSDITLDSAGNPVVVFSTMDDLDSPNFDAEYIDGRLELLRCSEPTCSSNPSLSLVDAPATTSPSHNILSGLRIHMGASDVPTIFTNISNIVNIRQGGTPLVASAIVACLDPTCSATAAPVNLDTRILDVAIASNGNPIVLTTNTLIFCLDPGCSSSRIADLAPELVGSAIKMVLRDDVPIITSGRELIFCADAECSQFEVLRIDHALVTGALEITLTDDGLPVLAYTTTSPNPLRPYGMRIVQCQSDNCADRSYVTMGELIVHDMYLDTLGQPIVLTRTPTDPSGQAARMNQLIACTSPTCEANTTLCQGFPVTVDLNDPDALLLREYANVVHGTIGDDVIDLRSADGQADLVCANGGNDTIYGGPGNDSIRAGAGDDIVYGGAGDDIVIGGPGDDQVFGDDGDDTLHGNRGEDTLSGGLGDDRIFGYADNDIIFGDDGNDRLHGNFGEDQIFGGPGNDRIFGYGDNDILNGGDGDDFIGGNRGDDSINGGNGNDYLYGSDGKDTVNGGPGNDDVHGNAETDIVNGGDGNDRLDGGVLDDECNGGNGFDTATRCETITGVP